MFDGISDSIIASFIINLGKSIWNSDIINKIKLYIKNPNIYIKFTCVKKYDEFEYDLIEIKKMLFNLEKNYDNTILNNINYKTHGRNYLNFTINNSSASYQLDITIDMNIDTSEDTRLTLKIKSQTPTITNYRDCNDMIDLKVLNQMYKQIEKKYKLIETFNSYELISSSDKDVKYPQGNVIKEYYGTEEIIYNDTSIAIKSKIYDNLTTTLNKYKLKLFKN